MCACMHHLIVKKRLQNSFLGLGRWLSGQNACPRTHVKKPGMMLFSSNTSGGEDRQIPGTCWPASLANLVNCRPERGPTSKKKKKKHNNNNNIKQLLRLASGLLTHAHTDMCTQICLYMYVHTCVSTLLDCGGTTKPEASPTPLPKPGTWDPGLVATGYQGDLLEVGH